MRWRLKGWVGGRLPVHRASLTDPEVGRLWYCGRRLYVMTWPGWRLRWWYVPPVAWSLQVGWLEIQVVL